MPIDIFNFVLKFGSTEYAILVPKKKTIYIRRTCGMDMPNA